MPKRFLQVAVAGLLTFLVGFYAGRAQLTTVHAQGPAPSGKVGTIPKTWGAFKGSAGVDNAVFEDSNGTVRLVDLGKFLQGRGTPELMATLNRQ